MSAHFDLLKGVPSPMALTDAGASDWRHMATSLRPGRTYVMGGGHAWFGRLNSIRAAGGSVVCSVP